MSRGNETETTFPNGGAFHFLSGSGKGVVVSSVGQLSFPDLIYQMVFWDSGIITYELLMELKVICISEVGEGRW